MIKLIKVTIRNIFSTSTSSTEFTTEFLVEFFDTVLFLTSILAISRIHIPGIVPIGVGLVVWAIGMGLGGLLGSP